MVPCVGIVSAFHRPRRPLREVEVYIYSNFDLGTRRGEGSASRPGRTLPPGKTRYPLSRRLGGPQDRSEHVRKVSSPPGFDPWIVQPVGNCYTDYATRVPCVLVGIQQHFGVPYSLVLHCLWLWILRQNVWVSITAKTADPAWINKDVCLSTWRGDFAKNKDNTSC